MQVAPPPVRFAPERDPPHTELVVIDAALAAWAKVVLNQIGTRSDDAGREAVREELVLFLRGIAGRTPMRIYAGKWAYYLQMIDSFRPAP